MSDERPEPAGGSGERPDPAADPIRAALNRARAAARARGDRPAPASGRGPRPRVAGERRRPAGATYSDARDPQPVAESVHGLIDDYGWQNRLAVGGVLGRWDAVVGAEVAAHCQPEAFTDGVLIVRADSTAWATQVRLLAPRLLARLAEEVGPEVVKKVAVRGPAAPTWRRGGRVAPGSLGPRDTYG